MWKLRNLLLLCTLALVAPAAFADTLSIINSTFSVPANPCAPRNYAYQTNGSVDCTGFFPLLDFNGTAGFGWTLNASSLANGLTAGGTAFMPPDFTGLPFSQAAFLQGNSGEILQSIAGFGAGQTYTLSFYLGSRFLDNGFNDGNQTVEALIDGNVIGTWALSSFTPFTLETATFTVGTSGDHTLEFIGTNSGDHTAFLSDPAIATVPEPSTLALIGSGLLIVGARLRRKFRRS